MQPPKPKRSLPPEYWTNEASMADAVLVLMFAIGLIGGVLYLVLNH